MDKYKEVVVKDKYKEICNLDDSNIKEFQLSYDKFNRFIKDENIKNKKYINKLIINDEDIINSIDSVNLRLDTLNFINKLKTNKIIFNLSDSTMPIYNSLISNMKWKNKNSSFYMNIDRNPVNFKDLKLELCKGKICLDEEQLIWLTDKTLKTIKNNLNDNVYYNTIDLKNLSFNYSYFVNQKYHLDKFTDFDKVFFTYKYIRNSIKPCRDGIKILGSKEYIYDPYNCYKYAKEPLGTYLHKNGYSTGQSRLMTVLLNNPYMLVDTGSIKGEDKFGFQEMSGSVIDNKLYYTSLNKGGVFTNIDKRNFKADESEIRTKIYEYDNLDNLEILNICNHIKKLKR